MIFYGMRKFGKKNINWENVLSKIKELERLWHKWYKGRKICDTLHDLVPFVQFKNRENTHGGVLLLVKLCKCCPIPPSVTYVIDRFCDSDVALMV